MYEEDFFDLDNLCIYSTSDGRPWYWVKTSGRFDSNGNALYVFEHEDETWRIIQTVMTLPGGAADPYTEVVKFVEAYEYNDFDEALECIDSFLGYNGTENFGYFVSDDYTVPSSVYEDFDVVVEVANVDGVFLTFDEYQD